ncbi:topless-related protein 1-like isoform X2 [Solanum tuberosum]|uniref:topless-related protein 1-like isoform X2 n=1 Tax=Solanum tuberosum TaxID=4113 RepID=UPI00073A25A5|nr:PREDICTED: topless-related protein 1-like isoform X2 [Solanum tuberosum]
MIWIGIAKICRRNLRKLLLMEEMKMKVVFEYSSIGLKKRLLTTFMPATTFSEFYLQDNNVIAIGMDDSYIQIYNVQVNEVKTKLKGHHKRITGLAFSNSLNVLISTGADYQVN